MAPRLPGPHDFLASGAGAALASRHASQPICADAVARSRSVLASPDPEPTIDAAAGPSAHARDVHAGAPPVAVLLVGLLRTFVREDVHRSIKTNLVDSLAGVGASDVYLRVGPSMGAASARRARESERRANYLLILTLTVQTDDCMICTLSARINTE